MEQCIRDAIFHLDCAKQALEASVTDPEGWKKDSDNNARVIMKLLPIMCLLSLHTPQTHTRDSSPSVESLQEEHSEYQ